jgi:ABC-type multidrug transport system fused ATPase/permease subunit
MAVVPYRRTFVRLLTYLRPYKWTLWASIVLAVASQGAQFGTLYVTSTAVEKTFHGHDRHLLKLIVAAVLLIGLARALAMMGRRPVSYTPNRAHET